MREPGEESECGSLMFQSQVESLKVLSCSLPTTGQYNAYPLHFSDDTDTLLCQVSRCFWTIFHSLHDPRISSDRLQIALHDIQKSLLIMHSSVISIDINISSDQ